MPVVNKAWPYPLDLCQVRQIYNEGKVVFQGFSPYADATDTDPKWVILKLHYSGNDMIGIDFADNDDSPNKVWEDYDSYTYQLDT